VKRGAAALKRAYRREARAGTQQEKLVEANAASDKNRTSALTRCST